MILLILTLTRLALSAIFGVAGVTKLSDLHGTREAVRNFGAPENLVDAIAIVLPLSELAVAVALFFGNWAWWGAFAGLILLGLFIVVIGINLIRGRAPECHCFGQLYSRPLGWPTLIRNLIFALLAGLVLWQLPRSTAPNVVTHLVHFATTLSPIELWGSLLALVLVAGCFVFYLKKPGAKPVETTEMLWSQGLPLDAIAPAFELPAYEGGRKSLAELLTIRKPLVLMFSSPKCGPCAAIFSEVAEWQRTLAEQITIAIVSQGTVKDNFVNTARNSLRNVLLQQEREVAEVYQAKVTPTAVVVETSGRIASISAAGADEIRQLIQTTVAKVAQSNS